MKKALSVLLAMLVIFSMFGVVASAEGEDQLVTVKYFLNEEDAEPIKTVQVLPGTILNDYMPENPEKAATETTEYIFKGWLCKEDDGIYYKNGVQYVLKDCEPGTEIIFVAQFSEKNIEERQSFWNFIESIFERINLLFQYFATIFEW